MRRPMNKKEGQRGNYGVAGGGGGEVTKDLPRKGCNGKHLHLNTCTLPRETIDTVSRNY